MDYTCENCTSRHTWDCDDGFYHEKCENFKLDETTLSERERETLRVFRQALAERGAE